MPFDQFYSLPSEQQVGQFFFIGLPGTEVDAEARELIKEIQPGGIIIFGRNVESPQQVRKLIDDARALVPTPLLCGIDQEGASSIGYAGFFRRCLQPARFASTVTSRVSEHWDKLPASCCGCSALTLISPR